MDYKKVKGGWKFSDGIFVSEIQCQEMEYLVRSYSISGYVFTEKPRDLTHEIILALHDYNEDLRISAKILQERVERLDARYAAIRARFPDDVEAESYRMRVVRPVRFALKIYMHKHGHPKTIECITGGLCQE